MRGHLSVVIVCLTMILALSHVRADDLILCSDHIAAVDEQIQSCSNLVKQRHLGREELSLAYSHRALAYQRVKSYKKALLDFQRSVRLKPNDTDVRLNLGVIYEKLGQFGRAIANYTIAIKSDPEFSTAYFNRANAFEARGDLVKAIADYKQSIQLNVKDADAINNLANAYYKSGQLDKAEETYRRALEIAPQHRLASLNLKQISSSSKAEILPSSESKTSIPIDDPASEMVSDNKMDPPVKEEIQALVKEPQESPPLSSKEESASKPLKEKLQSAEQTTKEEEKEEFTLPPGIFVTGSY